jgi:hypothetical protein
VEKYNATEMEIDAVQDIDNSPIENIDCMLINCKLLLLMSEKKIFLQKL